RAASVSGDRADALGRARGADAARREHGSECLDRRRREDRGADAAVRAHRPHGRRAPRGRAPDVLHAAGRLAALGRRRAAGRPGRERRCPKTPALGCASCAKSCPSYASGSRSCGGIFDLASKQAKLEELQQRASDPELWNDRERAERVLREQRELEKSVGFFAETQKLFEEPDLFLTL